MSATADQAAPKRRGRPPSGKPPANAAERQARARKKRADLLSRALAALDRIAGAATLEEAQRIAAAVRQP